MSTGYSFASYQANWTSLSANPDSTVNDGDVTTGALSTGPPSNMTGAIDIGSSKNLTSITTIIGYAATSPSFIVEYSTDHITWVTTGLPPQLLPSHGGVFSSETFTMSGLSITAQYIRVSIKDLVTGNVEVYEISFTVAYTTDQFTQTVQPSRLYRPTQPIHQSLFHTNFFRTPVIGNYYEATIRRREIYRSDLYNSSVEPTSPTAPRVFDLYATFSGRTLLSASLSPPIQASFIGKTYLSATLTTSLTVTSADYSVLIPTPLHVGVLATITFTRLRVGAASNITVTPSTAGTLVGSPVSLPAFGSGSATVTFTPSVVGPITFTFTNSGGLTNPSPANTTVTGLLSSACGGTSTYTGLVASGLPVTLAPGASAVITFAGLPNWANVVSMDRYRIKATVSPTAKFLYAYPFTEVPTVYPNNGIGIVDTAGGHSGYGPNSFPILMGFSDNPSGTASYTVRNNHETVSVTLTSLEVDIQCTTCSIPTWSCSSYEGIVTLVWVDTTGNNNALKSAQHRTMTANAGNPTVGWEATDTVIPSCVATRNSYVAPADWHGDPLLRPNGENFSVSICHTQSETALVTAKYNSFLFTNINKSRGEISKWSAVLPAYHLYNLSDGTNTVPYQAGGIGYFNSSASDNTRVLVFGTGNFRYFKTLDGEYVY